MTKDIEDVLLRTAREFGQEKYAEYKVLIRLALADIAAKPDQPPARRHALLHPDARLFHIARPGMKARHLFFYRVIENRYVLLGGFLHDSIDLQRHVPGKFRA